MEKRFECLVRSNTRSMTVDVFTEKNDKETIKELALAKAGEALDELGISYDRSELNAIGYKKLSAFIA